MTAHRLTFDAAKAVAGELAEAEARGDTDAALAARWRLALAVADYARKRAWRVSRGDNDQADDLTQHALAHLVERAHTWDPERAGLMTWASWHLKGAIGRAPENRGDAVDTPQGHAHLHHVTRRVLAEGGTLDDAAEATGHSAEGLQAILNARSTAVRLDKPLYDGTDTTGRDLLPAGARPLDELLDDTRQRARVRALIERLPERERAVLEGRLQGLSLAAIAAPLSLSRERVRQLEQQAIQRITGWLTDAPPPAPVSWNGRALTKTRQRWDAPAGRCPVLYGDGTACHRPAADRGACEGHARTLRRLRLTVTDLPLIALEPNMDNRTPAEQAVDASAADYHVDGDPADHDGRLVITFRAGSTKRRRGALIRPPRSAWREDQCILKDCPRERRGSGLCKAHENSARKYEVIDLVGIGKRRKRRAKPRLAKAPTPDTAALEARIAELEAERNQLWHEVAAGAGLETEPTPPDWHTVIDTVRERTADLAGISQLLDSLDDPSASPPSRAAGQTTAAAMDMLENLQLRSQEHRRAAVDTHTKALARVLGIEGEETWGGLLAEVRDLLALRDAGDPVLQLPQQDRRGLLLAAVAGIGWPDARGHALELLDGRLEQVQAAAVAELGADLWTERRAAK